MSNHTQGPSTLTNCRSADLDARHLAMLLRHETGRHMHTIIVVRDGVVALRISAKPFRADVPQECYSMSKSFVSTAIGIAVGEGLLHLDDQVSQFFPEATIPHAGGVHAVTIRHLLTMTVGMRMADFQRIWNQDDWVRAFFRTPITDEPGTRFEYNNFASFMLSAVVQKVAGHRLLDYLDRHLFRPMGITNTSWERLGRGADWGASGLYISADDMARMGRLWLQRGNWNGRQLVPRDYLTAATRKQTYSTSYADSIPEWTESYQGYGFHFWMNSFGGFRASGMLGQELVVVPRHRLVVVMLGCLTQSKVEELEVIPRHLIPACRKGYAGHDSVLTAAAASFQAGLTWPRSTRQAEAAATRLQSIGFVPNKLYVLERPIVRGAVFNVRTYHQAFAFSFAHSEAVIGVVDDGTRVDFRCGLDGHYRMNDLSYPVADGFVNILPALVGMWQSERVFHFEIRPLAINMWIPYWVDFTDADNIVVRTYLDARSIAHGRSDDEVSVRGIADGG